MQRHHIKLTVNGDSHELDVDPRRTLMEILREELELHGTHEGCGSGDCGACTVLLDDEPVPSCLVLAADVDGREVVTVEGLVQNGEPHAVQKAIVAHGGIQCGYCTPGIVISSVALLKENPHPTEHEVREAIAGNLCRCTGYQKIVDAVVQVGASSAH
ncbi:MAG: (2Fe-2S)-binding protein [Chloroflexi bacterium]|nr:(2Fe-2S)-binding protein [Chloroflexota bacterium]